MRRFFDIVLILILFSGAWFLIWSWFFKIRQENVVRFKRVVNKALDKGNYKRAKEIILQALKAEKTPELEYQLGITQLNLNELKDAKKTFEKMIAESPQNIDLMLKLAVVLFKDTEFDESFEVYENVLKIDDKNIDAMLGKARILIEKDDYVKALVILEKANEIAPDNNDVIVLRLKCKSELIDIDHKEEYDKIIEQFKEKEFGNEKSAEFNLAFAKAYAKSGEVDKAIELGRRAVQNDSNDIKSYQMLGLLYLIKKDYPAAKNILNIAFGLDAKNEVSHKIFSYVLCQQVDNCPLHICRDKYFELIQKHFK